MRIGRWSRLLRGITETRAVPIIAAVLDHRVRWSSKVEEGDSPQGLATVGNAGSINPSRAATARVLPGGEGGTLEQNERVGSADTRRFARPIESEVTSQLAGNGFSPDSDRQDRSRSNSGRVRRMGTCRIPGTREASDRSTATEPGEDLAARRSSGHVQGMKSQAVSGFQVAQAVGSIDLRTRSARSAATGDQDEPAAAS